MKLIKKNLVFLLTLIFAAILFHAGAPTAEAACCRVFGKITATKKSVANIPLALLRYEKKDQGPPVMPLLHTESKEDGTYSFAEFTPEPGIQYLVGILFHGDRTASELFSLDGLEEKEVNFDFTSVKPASAPAYPASAPAYPASAPASPAKSSSQPAFKGKGYQVFGKVSAPGSPVDKVQLALLRFDPNNTSGGPPMSPIMRTETQPDGSYVFEDVQVEEGMEYMVGILFLGERKASERFDFSDEKAKEINFNYGASSQDPSAIMILKSTKVFQYDLSDDSLRITDFLIYHNTSGGIVNLSNDPLIYRLPEGAYSFIEFPMTERSGEFKADGSLVTMGIYSDSPTGQLVFEYSLSIDKLPMVMNFPLLPSITEVETIFRDEEVMVTSPSSFSAPIPKNIGRNEYISNTYKIESGTQFLKLTLERRPVKQLHIAFFAGGLLVVMLLIFAFSIPRMRKITQNSESVQADPA